MQTSSAGTDLEWHSLDVGIRFRAAEVARDRLRGGRDRALVPRPEPNAVARMLGLLGDEWTLLVVQQVLLGATRFADFKARLPISNSVLTRRLRSLTRDGLLDRRVYQTNPTRFEYLVTPRSRSLWPVLLSIWEWERRWVPDHAARLPRMRHQACDADFAPLLICRAC